MTPALSPALIVLAKNTLRIPEQTAPPAALKLRRRRHCRNAMHCHSTSRRSTRRRSTCRSRHRCHRWNAMHCHSTLLHRWNATELACPASGADLLLQRLTWSAPPWMPIWGTCRKKGNGQQHSQGCRRTGTHPSRTPTQMSPVCGNDLCYLALVVNSIRLGLPDPVCVLPHLRAEIAPLLLCFRCICAPLLVLDKLQ